MKYWFKYCHARPMTHPDTQVLHFEEKSFGVLSLVVVKIGVGSRKCYC